MDNPNARNFIFVVLKKNLNEGVFVQNIRRAIEVGDRMAWEKWPKIILLGQRNSINDALLLMKTEERWSRKLDNAPDAIELPLYSEVLSWNSEIEVGEISAKNVCIPVYVIKYEGSLYDGLERIRSCWRSKNFTDGDVATFVGLPNQLKRISGYFTRFYGPGPLLKPVYVDSSELSESHTNSDAPTKRYTNFVWMAHGFRPRGSMHDRLVLILNATLSKGYNDKDLRLILNATPEEQTAMLDFLKSMSNDFGWRFKPFDTPKFDNFVRKIVGELTSDDSANPRSIPVCAVKSYTVWRSMMGITPYLDDSMNTVFAVSPLLIRRIKYYLKCMGRAFSDVWADKMIFDRTQEKEAWYEHIVWPLCHVPFMRDLLDIVARRFRKGEVYPRRIKKVTSGNPPVTFLNV